MYKAYKNITVCYKATKCRQNAIIESESAIYGDAVSLQAPIVKVPKNLQTRLSPDVWLAGEAIARYRAMTTRDAFEYSVRAMVDKLSSEDPEFRKIWLDVKQEGIEEG